MVALPFELYCWLIKNRRRRSLEERQVRMGHLAHDWLGVELGADLTALWDSGHWIPQESLGFEALTHGLG